MLFRSITNVEDLPEVTARPAPPAPIAEISVVLTCMELIKPGWERIVVRQEHSTGPFAQHAFELQHVPQRFSLGQRLQMTLSLPADRQPAAVTPEPPSEAIKALDAAPASPHDTAPSR